MIPFDSPFFLCPICRSPLTRLDRSLFCQNRHTFDISAKGHVNLLRAFGKAHGDNAAMVAARRAFLSTDAYDPMRQAVAAEIQKHKSGGILLDSGCGEGYYTERFAALDGFSVYGIDISPKACEKLAKKGCANGVAVASAYDLPIAAEAVDVITNIFSPFCHEEFHRILKNDGIIIDVIPAERHLWELKAAIYENPYENRPKETIPEGFSLIERQEVTTVFSLSSQEMIKNLVLMTPYFYRTGKDGHKKLASLSALDITASFYLLVYRKTQEDSRERP